MLLYKPRPVKILVTMPHLSDDDSPEDGDVAREQLSPGQSSQSVRLELHLQPPAGDEADPLHSLQDPPQLLPDLSGGDLEADGGDGLDAEPPVVHTLGHSQLRAVPDRVVVELLDGGLGVLPGAVLDIAVVPAHQDVRMMTSQLLDLAHTWWLH